MHPTFVAELRAMFDTLFGALFLEVASEASFDRQIIAIAERMEQRIAKILLKPAPVLVRPLYRERLDSLVSDLHLAARDLRWLNQGDDAPGPKRQKELLLDIKELDFTLQFGRTLRQGAVELKAYMQPSDPEERYVRYLRMLPIHAELAAKLVGRTCPAKFQRAYRQFQFAVAYLTYRHEGGGSGGVTVKSG